MNRFYKVELIGGNKMLSFASGQVVKWSHPRLEQATSLLFATASGLGLEIAIVQRPSEKAHWNRCLQTQESCLIYLYSHIKEDAFDLFGFSTFEEKRVFEKLLKVNGIGPKSALSCLSSYTPLEFIQKILSQSPLVKIPGVGKKTLERMMIDLKEPFEALRGLFQEDLFFGVNGNVLDKKEELHEPHYLDYVSALMDFGYKKSQATSVLELLAKRKQPHWSDSDWIKQALYQLQRK